MNRVRSLFVGLMVAVVVPASLGAESGAPVLKADNSVTVFQLKHAGPDSVAESLQRLIKTSFSVAVDYRTNQVLVDCDSAETIEKMAQIVRLLDVPVHEKENGRGTVILKVKNRRAQALLPIVQAQLGGRGVLQVDPATNSFVVSDDQSNIVNIKTLLNDLDRMPGSLSLQFMVFGPSESGIPEYGEFRKVREELRALGLGGYGIISRASIRVIEGERFEATGSYGVNGMLQIEGSSQILSQSGQEVVETRLNAAISTSQGEGNSKDRRHNAGLQTTLTMPMGHLMIIGMTPAGEDPTKPLVLALRVVRG